MKLIYLDNSATTKPLPETREAVIGTMEEFFGNPSSLHSLGVKAESIIDECREKIASELGSKNENIIFTSGGTESNNLAIKGIADAYGQRGHHIITSTIEHASVLEPMKYLENKGFRITYLPVDRYGFVDPLKLKESLTQKTILVSIMHVNNEIGTLQPIEELASIIKENSTSFFHCDMVQSFLKIPISIQEKGPDLISLSGHKVRAPKGVGALFIKEGIRLEPLFHGGGQEKNLRSGTENVISIAGFTPVLGRENNYLKVKEMKDYLAHRLIASIPNAICNTPPCSGPHILSISFPGLKSEILLHALEEEGIYVATGSACHSHHDKTSHVLKAIGLSHDLSEGTIRISLSEDNTFEDIEIACVKIKEVVQMLFSLGGKR